LIAEGAHILDIGGESSRPGAAAVSVDEELARVIPVLEALREVSVPLSIDTFKPEVMCAAIAVGATIVNDINALQSEGALQVVGQSNVAVCLMHKQGNPETMQQSPQYVDVIQEVFDFLRQRLSAVESAGIGVERVVIDPGFGFGKSLVHNLALLKALKTFVTLGVPVLAGLSRKSMLGAMTGRAVEDRGSASVAAALIAVQRGAAIVRVHDVKETVDALKIWNAVNTGELR
jgi:dihydropteroate synthase